MPGRRFYVTTPIYYVNGPPHVGHAYSTVLADVLARSHRLLGVPTFFTTGTDEHGLKMQQAAAQRGIGPKEFCDEMSQLFAALLVRLDISHDHFVRTTDPAHEEVARRAAQKLFDQGDIYQAPYEGWYCARCERYWTDREVEERGGGRCPDQPELHEIERLAEHNYFFRMSKYADELTRRIEAGEFVIEPEKRRNEILGFLRKGVWDLCISRSKTQLTWGVDLPFDDGYVMYVWVDALMNYESSVGYLGDTDDHRARHARWWPADVHLVGKDILTTHAVYWPTLLLALGEPLPRKVLAHGWLLDPSGRKFSKTKVAGEEEVRPQPSNEEMLDVVGADGMRWFLATAMRPGDDTMHTWDVLCERYNTDLANGIGNSANRILKMIANSADGRLPALGEPGAAEAPLIAATAAQFAALRAVPQTLDLMEVAARARDVESSLSGYLSAEQPWSKVKSAESLPRALQVLAWSAETLRQLGLALIPFMPAKMTALREAFGLRGEVNLDAEARFGAVPEGTALGAPPNLFPRVTEADLPASAR